MDRYELDGHRPLRWTVLLGCLLVVATGTLAQPSPPPVSDGLDALTEDIQQVIDERGMPGAAVALIPPEGPIWTRGFGLADRATGRPVTADTSFRVASLSKMFVGVAALQQQERGNLTLTGELATLAPDLPFHNPWAEDHPVRLVHLLEQTSGWDEKHAPELYAREPGMSLREQLTQHVHSNTLRWVPGRFYAYTDKGISVAAYAVQQAAGREYEAYVAEEIFAPLGMTRATYDRSTAIERGLAAGYTGPDKDEAVDYRHYTVRPAASVSASVRGLARFVRMRIQRGTLDGRRVLTPASTRRLEQPTTTLAAKAHDAPVGYGLTTVNDTRDGFLWHGHFGGVPGYSAAAYWLDGHQRGYVVLTNSSAGGRYEIADLLEDHLTRGLSGSPPDPIAVDPDELAPYAGYYVGTAPRNEIDRLLHTLTAVLHATPIENGLRVGSALEAGGSPWLWAGEGRFRNPDDSVVSHHIVGGPDGRYLQVDAGEGGSYVHTAAWIVWGRWLAVAAAGLLMATSIGFALIWIPRKLAGGLREPIQERLWPLLASLGFGVFAVSVWMMMAGITDATTDELNPYSVAVMLGSGALALCAAVAAIQTVRHRRTDRLAWWHSCLTTAACLLATGWLAHYGLIGIRLWAY